MTVEERYKITSNDFADFIINYNQNTKMFDQFPNITTHILNDRYAFGYVPVNQMTASTITQYGYTVIPACYGLSSEKSIEASGITRLRRLPKFDLRGEGILIGIVDTGIDYTNSIFRKADGTTKILSLWDQTIDSENYPTDYLFGTQYIAADINKALQSDEPFNIVPSRDEIGHGTIMAGIAVGNEVLENNFSGVAPDSELVIVKLKQAKQVLRDFYIIPENVPCYQENDIMWAFRYLITSARNLKRPMVICIGLGTSQGSHDGRGPLSTILSIGGRFSGICVIVAAGNEGNMRRHFYSTIDPSIGYSTVELNVDNNEAGFSMELWGTSPNTYSIDIMSPTGEYIPRIPESLKLNRDISFVFERTRITVDYQMVESTTGDQLILLRFRNPTAGTWRFQVYGKGNLQGSFHIWLPMGKFISENTFFVQSDPYTTVTSPGNSQIPITVTAYNSDNNTLYAQASRGYSRINTVKPDLAAPGVNIMAPTLDQGFAPVTGTSVSAAHTAGVAAIIMEWAIIKNNYPGVSSVEVKKFMQRGAKRTAGQTYPNRDWGYGILDVFNVFDILRTAFQ